MEVIKYKNREFLVVENNNISSSEHCDYCDFKDLCDDYIDEQMWFPCGATFNSNKIYLKEYNRNE